MAVKVSGRRGIRINVRPMVRAASIWIGNVTAKAYSKGYGTISCETTSPACIATRMAEIAVATPSWYLGTIRGSRKTSKTWMRRKIWRLFNINRVFLTRFDLPKIISKGRHETNLHRLGSSRALWLWQTR